MKCCAVLVNGEWLDVYKDPTIYDSKTWEPIVTTEANFKTSKRGRLELMYNAQTGAYETMTSENVECYDGKFGWEKVLVTVYEDGYLVEEWSFDEVRANALKPVKKAHKGKALHGDFLTENEDTLGLDKKPAGVLEK
jgi:nicotinamide phosphoribosyltransferase